MAYRILRLPDVLRRKGASRSKTYNEIAAGTWPPPVALGPRSRGWPEHEVDAVLAARIAGRSDAEIRVIVDRLVAARARATAHVEAME